MSTEMKILNSECVNQGESVAKDKEVFVPGEQEKK